MWKAIINLINSKAYRCEHNWEKIDEVNVYWTEKSKLPHRTKHTYRCTRCCEGKTIKS
jgi:hypothetical protein